MRSSSSTHWFSRLAPAEAARVVTLLVNTQLGDWRPIERTPSAIIFRCGQSPEAIIPIGAPADGLPAAVVRLNRRMSRVIYQRIQTDRAFRTCLLVGSAQAVLDGDVPLAQGLLRRLIDATIGFTVLAQLMDAHPKSLIRMLGPRGNPSARHLASILARAACADGMRLRAAIAPSQAPASAARPRR